MHRARLMATFSRLRENKKVDSADDVPSGRRRHAEEHSRSFLTLKLVDRSDGHTSGAGIAGEPFADGPHLVVIGRDHHEIRCLQRLCASLEVDPIGADESQYPFGDEVSLLGRRGRVSYVMGGDPPQTRSGEGGLPRTVRVIRQPTLIDSLRNEVTHIGMHAPGRRQEHTPVFGQCDVLPHHMLEDAASTISRV